MKHGLNLKAVSVLGIIICWFECIQSQVYLSSNGTATQSSRYREHYATLAVTGGPTHEWSSWSCSATAANKRYSWWMYTFKSELVYITDVIIYYRGNNPSRLAGYSLFVTNNSILSTATAPPKYSHLCYHHGDDELPDVLQNVTCNSMGKHVIVYNERKSGESYPSVYSPNALLELCDVQIFGCYKTWWGENCSTPCPVYCVDQHCHPSTGICLWGCRPNHCLDSMCTPDALCSSGCHSGFAGQICDEHNIVTSAALIGMNSDSYNQRVSFINDGDKRSSSCVQLSGNDPFIKIDLGESYIIVSIHITFKGNDTTSNYTMTVANTKTVISQTIQSTNDNISELLFPFSVHIHEINPLVTGRFIELYTLFPGDVLDICEIEVTGCRPGMLGKLCDESCPEHCDGACDPRDGRCLFGCKGAYRGWNCSDACQSGFYGDQCEKKCPTNCNGPCQPETGRCVSGCKLSFVGFTCDEACLPGKFGTFCNKSCPGNCNGQCDRTSGACLIKCEGSSCAKDQSSTTAVAVGITVSVLVVGIAVLGVCIYKRRKKPQQNNNPTNITYNQTSERTGASYNELYEGSFISFDNRTVSSSELIKIDDTQERQGHDNTSFTDGVIYDEVNNTKVTQLYEDMTGKC